MVQIGLALMAIGPLLVVFTLIRAPRALRHEIGVLELVGPTAAGVFILLVGAGVAELGLDSSGVFIAPALIKLGLGIVGIGWLALRAARERRI